MSKIKRILVIKLGAIGDVIMATPLLSAIWKEHPECHIDWVCGKPPMPVLKMVNNPRLNIILGDEKKLKEGSPFEKIKEMLSIWRRLGLRKYDRIITPYYDFRYKLLTFWVRSDERFSYNKKHKRPCPIHGRHRSSEFVRLAMGLPDSGPDSQWPQYPQIKIPDLHEEFDSAIRTLKKPLICIAPGGAKNIRRDDFIRRWPVEHYVEFTQMAIQRGFTVIISGGPTDAWVLPYFEKLTVINMVGKTDISQLAALYAKMGAVVTHDSGPLHLADLVGTPVVSIFGPTDPYWSIPIKARSEMLWGGSHLPCRPCYDDHAYANCTDNLLKNGQTFSTMIVL
ncbi:MAG TPA: glycosyltransferase family 9 protein [Chitinispirillaceae bacterium]|nr:glycosyltransferase family 9 protein [Chitinispirillaceae bacterium]